LDWVTIHMGNELHLDSVGLSRAPARYVPIRHRCPLQIHQALVNQITMFYPSLPLVLTLVHCAAYVSSNPMPRINRGLFVIQGVATCDQGKGYCLLSQSCSVDAEFETGAAGDHCEGLKHGFDPNPGFVCCAISLSMEAKNDTTVSDEDTGAGISQKTVAAAKIDPLPMMAVKRTNQIISKFEEIRQRVPLALPESSSNDKSLLNVILFGMKHQLMSS